MWLSRLPLHCFDRWPRKFDPEIWIFFLQEVHDVMVISNIFKKLSIILSYLQKTIETFSHILKHH